jgi:rubrerythrin
MKQLPTPGAAMTRSFALLNPQQALHAAVFVEERNAGIYQRFAEMFAEFRDPESLEIASVFWDMSVEEKRHSSLLQIKYVERYGNASCALTENDLQEMIEVPRLESSDFFAPAEVAKPVGRERAIKVALDAEKNAQEFYAQLVDRTEDGELRRLYVELATMEDGHVTYLQGMLAASTVGRDSDVH